MGLINLDACLIIYLREEHPVFGSIVAEALAADPSAGFAVSPLTVMECLIKPFADANQIGEANFREYFASLEMLDLDAAVFERAARLRAQTHSLKTPEAIHLAAAQQHGCEALWTNDDRFVAAADGFAVNITADDRAKDADPSEVPIR